MGGPMERLNFNHLFYFYIVAKEGSIKASAEKLHVSQPTISDQIKLLEDYLEAPLFVRRNRSLFLTKEGDLALEYAENMFNTAQELVYRIRNKVELPKKTLDIGITYFMSQYFLYDTILPLFSLKDIKVNVQEGDRHLLFADLEIGKIDMVFTDTRENMSTNMSAHRMGINRTYAVAHKKFSKYKKNFPESLNEIAFFNYTRDSFLKYEIDLFFAKHAISPQVIGEGDDMDLFQLVTENALAYTIVPEPAKNRLTMNPNVCVLGEIEDLQTSVWGIVKKDYKGLGFKLLQKQL